MSRYYVTGGKQRSGASGITEWFSYREAAVHVFDDADGSVRECVSYRTPDEIRPDHERANIVFKAATRAGDLLHVPTQTEILTYSLPDFRQVGYVSHPWFNDIHHIRVNAAGNFLVVSTGLDLALEVTPAGTVLREWSVLPDEDPLERFNRDTDYRGVLSTKPHHAHPNYVFEHDGQVWVSRFEQRDLHCLTGDRPDVKIDVQRIHDGNLLGDEIYVTTVDGHVVRADLLTGEVLAVHDLNAYTDTDKDLGWCRGLHILDADRVLVGFSRLRPSKIKENLIWVKHRVGLRETSGKAPTRVACYDLAAKTLMWDVNLENHGLNAVFSILPAD